MKILEQLHVRWLIWRLLSELRTPTDSSRAIKIHIVHHGVAAVALLLKRRKDLASHFDEIILAMGEPGLKTVLEAQRHLFMQKEVSEYARAQLSGYHDLLRDSGPAGVRALIYATHPRWPWWQGSSHAVVSVSRGQIEAELSSLVVDAFSLISIPAVIEMANQLIWLNFFITSSAGVIPTWRFNDKRYFDVLLGRICKKYLDSLARGDVNGKEKSKNELVALRYLLLNALDYVGLARLLKTCGEGGQEIIDAFADDRLDLASNSKSVWRVTHG